MDDRSVCAPLLAESDAQNDTINTPNAASVSDADTVINTKIDSTQVEGEKSEEELLKSLLTDDYCHVCEAVLLFESQRLSHYEGKKHAQKLRVYLQAKRAEKKNKESTGPQRTMTTDKDHFCELCNMVFSSHVVARSHYEGKVHSKNLRKQGLQPPVIDRYAEVQSLPSLTLDPDNADLSSAPEGGMEHLLDPAATTMTPSTEVDLTDPNKYCALCAASFNNPQMALQHYNGRKHQRNQTRQKLLKELGDNVQQANSLMCQMCSLQFNSVEMYQAHMQGNKHQIREKKVIDLCKSQQKAYSTFTDELSDYIQIQKARGITPKGGQILSLGDTQKEDEEEEDEALNKEDIIKLNQPMPSFPPAFNPPHHSRLGCYTPVGGWRPPYQGPPWPSHGLNYTCAPPVLPGSDSTLFPSWPMKRRRRRKQSSSSSDTTSSSYSSSYSSSHSSHSSDSDGTEYRRREKRRIRRSRRERDKRARDENSDRDEKRRKRQRRERAKESEERRRGESGESEEERRRKKRKNHGKRRRRDKKSQEEDSEAAAERAMDNLMPEVMMDNRKETEGHVQAEVNVEQEGVGQGGPPKPKCRKEKKKTKEKVDTRTEEEKLWDDSILGC
ncbi:zinc finger matrin-type protein 1 [Chaetodon trifascialis]|uniref:zinc finger matrin-type protein 1 n=1 Tax=Chaetodon trifascialis TaxID=109706 RepID=UPI0039964849